MGYSLWGRKKSDTTEQLSTAQVSQDRGKAIWYSQLFKNFSVSCDPHKDFSIGNEAGLFLEFSGFLYDPRNIDV